MSDAERLVERVATATGIGTAPVRAVWLREASARRDGDLFERCSQRVVEFATRGKQSADGDLWPDGAAPVTAASRLLIWNDVPTDARGAELLALGTRVVFADRGAKHSGILVRSTADSVTVLANGALRVLAPSDVTCT